MKAKAHQNAKATEALLRIQLVSGDAVMESSNDSRELFLLSAVCSASKYPVQIWYLLRKLVFTLTANATATAAITDQPSKRIM